MKRRLMVRSIDAIKKDWDKTDGFLANLTIDVSNAQKLDLVVELLFGVHENQVKIMDELAQAARERRTDEIR